MNCGFFLRKKNGEGLTDQREAEKVYGEKGAHLKNTRAIGRPQECELMGSGGVDGNREAGGGQIGKGQPGFVHEIASLITGKYEEGKEGSARKENSKKKQWQKKKQSFRGT